MNEKYQGADTRGLHHHRSSQPLHSFTILLPPLIPKTNKAIMQKISLHRRHSSNIMIIVPSCNNFVIVTFFLRYVLFTYVSLALEVILIVNRQD